MSIELVCHRGANEYAPENTYASARKCIGWGVDYVEIDVNMSKDNVLFVMHGPQIDKTTNGTGYMSELTAAEIDKLDAGSWFGPQYAGESVPRFDEFLHWCKGKTKLFIDVKAADHDSFLKALTDAKMEDECFIWSASDQWLLELSQIAPDLPIKINASTIDAVIEAEQVYNAKIIEVGLDTMSAKLRQACRQRDIKVMIYVKEKSRSAYQEVINWQADMINLNHADLFLDVLHQNQPHPIQYGFRTLVSTDLAAA